MGERLVQALDRPGADAPISSTANGRARACVLGLTKVTSGMVPQGRMKAAEYKPQGTKKIIFLD